MAHRHRLLTHNAIKTINRLVLSCLVGVLANTPGGVKRSGLGAHAVGFLVVY